MTRLLDLFLSAIALMILSPLLVLVVVILKFTGEGEVFFPQDRVGKGSECFSLLKFATMLKDSPNIGTGTVTVKGDPRILPFGKFLRKSKINELPQLINVFLGQMSLIGPRPLTPQTFDAYPDKVQAEIVKVRPGLSGIGSVVFRDEENILSGENASVDFYREVVAPYKGTLEVWFVKNHSLVNYLLLIACTIVAVLNPTSKLVWKLFRSLPMPPENLRKALGYSEL